MAREIPDEAYCEIYRLPGGTLRSLKAKGADPSDARTIFAGLIRTTRKPDAWREFFESSDQDTHEGLKKEKTREEVERLRLGNAKAKGDSFDRADGETIMVAWSSALNLALAEMRAMMPPQLVGLDESALEKRLDDDFRKLQSQLGDLDSELWRKVYDQYSSRIEESSADAKAGGNTDSPAQASGKPVVSRKREADSGPRS